MWITLYIICYLDVSKVSSILHPVTFKFAYGHQSRGTSTASAASLFDGDSTSNLSRKETSGLWLSILGLGDRPVSHVPSYLLPCSSPCCITLPSFLPYAYNAEITRKNSTMTVMRYQVVNLQMCTFIRINDSYMKACRDRGVPDRNRRHICAVALTLHDIYISRSKTDNECRKKIMRVLQTVKADVRWSHRQTRASDKLRAARGRRRMLQFSTKRFS